MQNKIMNKKRIKFKLWFRFLLSLIILFCFISSIYIMKLGIEYTENSKEEYIYSYDIENNIDYKVYLYDNSFIDADYLTEGKMFVSELVKNIIINFNYNYEGNKEIDLKYNYKIKGILICDYKDGTDVDNNILSKEYVFVDEVTKELNNQLRIMINEEVMLDFSKFDEEVKTFKNKFGLFINSRMEIKMDISIDGVVEDKEFNDTKQLLISIPLGVQAFTITEDYLASTNENINRVSDSIIINNKIYIGVILMFLSVVFFALLFKIIFNITKQTNYNKKLERILKNYGEVIVEINNYFNETEYKIVEVKGIEEMVDLEQELRIPINYYEITKDYLGVFILIHGNILYKYTLTDDN